MTPSEPRISPTLSRSDCAAVTPFCVRPPDVAGEALQRQRDQVPQRVVAAPRARLSPGPGAACLDARLLEQLGQRRARAVAQRSQVDLEHELKADLVRRDAIARALGYVGWLRVEPGAGMTSPRFRSSSGTSSATRSAPTSSRGLTPAHWCGAP